MSRATKRKHVVQQLLEERVQPGEGQSVVRVLGTPGNNLHEVETAEGTRFLASMPPRFRRHIWIKRGDFLLVDPIQEGSKVKAEISLVLLPPHVRSLQRQGLWYEQKYPKISKISPKTTLKYPQKPPQNTLKYPKISQNILKTTPNRPTCARCSARGSGTNKIPKISKISPKTTLKYPKYPKIS
uniref:Probable RNA-binding protein EIF1AD n=1 Tax=Catharus ustulatus TaxID=91951 RepID=A0A8C3UZA5_CATUS